jgi:mechanosensitive ion channel-like protein
MREQFDLILDSLQSSWFQIAAYLPRVLTAIVLLLLGWLIARTVQRVVVRLLRLARLEAAAEQTGVDDFLVRGGVRFTVVTLIGEIFYWGLLLIFAVAVFNLIGLTMSPESVARLTSYVPNVMAALVVLVFGSLGARLIRGLVVAYLGNVGVKGSDRIGFLVQAALVAFVVLLALEQLRIDVKLLASAFQLAFGGICLALAIAFGLGGRNWAESILERTWSKR